ncbi:peptidoglycan editing factor PgeF [Methylolobus aquaticus]|nr:peptidoglycan editing factor PgeF [Methylolobus aquaticus]
MTFWLTPEWPAPPGVRAASLLRAGGFSQGSYAALNLGDHVGDAAAVVQRNRQRVREALALPSEPVWLRQVHGSRVVDAEGATGSEADGAFTAAVGPVCAVMTADCLPVLLCSVDGQCVAAVHGGWRSLAAGILETTVTAMGTRRLIAWLGPAIGPEAFEVGNEVRDTFLTGDAELAGAFRSVGDGKWLADIYAIARRQLHTVGVDDCYGGGHCTYSDPDRFFSYRRDGITGRMATLIWRV